MINNIERSGVKMLNKTGIIRKIDELGRFVIPKELRKSLGIRDGEVMEIFLDDDNIVLKKYFQVNNSYEISKKLVEYIKNLYDVDLIITDREKVISSSSKSIETGSMLDKNMLELMDNREIFVSNGLSTVNVGADLFGYFTIVPIVSASDSVGLVVILSQNSNDYLALAKLVANIIADKLDIS